MVQERVAESTLVLGDAGNRVSLKINQQLLLTDSQAAWVVESGSLTVFTVVMRDGEWTGSRRYLFTARAGDVLVGIEPSRSRRPRGLLGTTAEPVTLRPLTQDHLWQQLEAQRPAALEGLEGWLDKLGSVLTQTPTAALQAKPDQTETYSLIPRQSLQPRKGSCVWLQLSQGSLYWVGQRELVLTPDSPGIPLSARMWVESVEAAQVQLRPLGGTAAELAAGMTQLHTHFLRYLDLLSQQEDIEAYTRFRERKRLNLDLMENAIDGLSTILMPPTVISAEGSPLMIAVTAVGQALGATIRPPSASEDMSKVKNPLEAIARSSRLRMRRVLLRGEWWQRDAGPLVGYTQPDHQPVALLPEGNGYVVFDPFLQTRTRVTRSIAAGLDPEAFMLYRSFPLTSLKVLDILRFAVGKRQSDLIAIVLSVTATTLLGFIAPQATAILIDQAIPDANRSLLFQMSLALLASAFGGLMFQLTQGYATLRVESFAEATTGSAVWDRLLNVEVPFFRQYATGDLVERVSAISEIRRKLTGSTLQTMLTSLFAFLNLGLLLYYNVSLALIALVVAAVSLGFSSLLGVLIFRVVRQLQEMAGQINGLIVELIGGISKLKVAGAESRAFAHWSRSYIQQQRLSQAQQGLQDILTLFNELLPLFSSIVLFFVASTLLTGEGAGLTTGRFLAFNAAFGSFVAGATGLSGTLDEMLEVASLWKRAKPILDARLESDLDRADPGRLRGELALQNVSFRYKEGGALILNNVSLQVDPGEFVALVGPSGSGKSTIFRMLLGFEQPLSGKILFDGQDLSGLNLQAVRRQLGVVMQNGRLTSASIFENIASGSLLTMDEAWEAARNAGFDQDIESMPMGMHTVISEGGGNLSGGQRQRLLIARALAIKPRILLFDEATSALDNRTQAIVSASLDRLRVTRIVIAHRLSTIRNADRIYVLKAGQVMESGSFEELVAQAGLFAKMMASQQM